MPEIVRTVGRYGILREIGRGGMGVVYLAHQVDLDRLVALKEMAAFRAADTDLAQRFVRESRLAGSLLHANVVTVFDYFEHEGTPFIAMEYVERGSLRPYIGRLRPAQIGGVLDGVLAGLEAAEQRGIVHRDLKPENLMVSSDGAVKITDFGIAKATQDSTTGAFMTATGTTIGTPAYMAPEQAMARDIGPWTDLYSVGCIAYELVVGAPPFHDADTPMAMMLRHINEPLPAVREFPDVDPALSDWIELLTSKDFRDRPATASAASEALEEILINTLGPRWRRESRLSDPPRGPSAVTPPTPATSEFQSFVWDQAAGTTEMFEGIDVEGTGPDTPEALPLAKTAPPTAPPPTSPAATTPPSATPPATTAPTSAEPPAPPPASTVAAAPPPASTTPVSAEPPAPPSSAGDAAVRNRAVLLARAGALGLLVALVLPALGSGDDRWNLFAAFSPLEAAGTTVASWLIARALKRGLALALAAGLLIGFGSVTAAGAIALLKFTAERLDPAAVGIAVIVLASAVALLAAGIACAKNLATDEPADPGTLVLGLAGTALVCVSLFVIYDGNSSLWSEVGETESAEFFFEPAILAAAMLAGVVMIGSARRFAGGLLIAAGFAGTLHFIGVLIAAWRAIGEVGDVGPAGLIGALGSLLVLAAGALVEARSKRAG